ncbi:hypothetical protein TYRP_013119 [Tyrophagus putrescentiae]|nr:hypothetical protein TYRP_013119 [Tyrophagus putrescentiae]
MVCESDKCTFSGSLRPSSVRTKEEARKKWKVPSSRFAAPEAGCVGVANGQGFFCSGSSVSASGIDLHDHP